MLPPLLALLASVAVAPAAEGPAAERGEVVVEMVVEDAGGRTIADLRSEEVVLAQDGARQVILSFRFLPEKGWYELRYAPDTGRAGAVAVRVARGGTSLRGPEGPRLRPRWIPPVPAFEKPLRAALEASPAPAAFEYDVAALRFETRGDTLHHTLLAEVPFGQVVLQPTSAGVQAHLAFFLRVKAEDGTVVHEGGLDQPLEVGAVGGSELGVRRFVWSAHVHLRPGRYLAEVAAMDRLAARVAVRRLPLDVEPWPPGLRVGSVAFLLGVGGVMAGERHGDDPLRLEDAALVPMLRPSLVAGSDGPSSLLFAVYPDPGSREPVTGTLELHRDGQLRARTAVPLPPPDAEGRIRTALGVKFASLQPGAYVVKLVAQQGRARAEQGTTVAVTTAPRVE